MGFIHSLYFSESVSQRTYTYTCKPGHARHISQSCCRGHLCLDAKQIDGSHNLISCWFDMAQRQLRRTLVTLQACLTAG